MPEPTELPAEVAANRGRLNAEELENELRRRGSTWPAPLVVGSVESTNADACAAASDGAPEGSLIVAEHQRRGRGRLDRSWESPPGAGLTFSVLLRPAPPPATWGWLPIVAGLALITAVRQVCSIEAALKWPNDLLLGPDQDKAAGILAESGQGAVVLGMGINVSTRPEELPNGATSLLVQGATVSREELLVAVVLALESLYAGWTAAAGDAERSGVSTAYLRDCVTLGRTVTVHLPNGETLTGVARSIGPSGGLQVYTSEDSLITVVAADVMHVRPD